jgi:hypothetical protein
LDRRYHVANAVIQSLQTAVNKLEFRAAPILGLMEFQMEHQQMRNMERLIGISSIATYHSAFELIFRLKKIKQL